MSADTRHTPLVQNYDLICAAYGADALRDNQYGGVFGFLCQRLAQSRVGLKVQSRKAVVKYVELRLFHQSARNGKPLLLSAREVIAALCHIRI